ncbi:hypothetical protein DL96DRAFT_1465384 [Flagelloscypha sp. PMI_526]|nr:hypothetical protein DL96DRAFT_1465384 [Flagelloscypha sp. PMI_526]
MPKHIVKRLTAQIKDFFWDWKQPLVNEETLFAPFEKGSRALLDLETRNEAIECTWVKSWLTFGPERPLWAEFADELMRINTPLTEEAIPIETRINIVLQQWKTRSKAGDGVPEDIRNLLQVVRNNEVRLEGLAIDREVLTAMPIWVHRKADKRGRRLMNSAASQCLRNRHGVKTVEDAMTAESTLGSADHRSSDRCQCEDCEWTRCEYQCKTPHSCAKRASSLLNLLPRKWDPRQPQPMDEFPPSNEQPADTNPISRDVRVKNTISNAIRIFGNTLPEAEPPNLILPPTQLTTQTIAVCGNHTSAHELFHDTSYAIYAGENNPLNQCGLIQTPPNLRPTRLNGEAAAVLIALQQCPQDWEIHFITSCKTLVSAINTNAAKYEDELYNGVKWPELLRSIRALIQQ